MQVTSRHLELLSRIREAAGWPHPLEEILSTPLAPLNEKFGTVAIEELRFGELVATDLAADPQTLSFTLAGKSAEAAYSEPFGDREDRANRRIELLHGIEAEPFPDGYGWRVFLSEEDSDGFNLRANLAPEQLESVSIVMHAFFEAGFKRGEFAGSAKTRRAVEEVAGMIFAPLVEPLQEFVANLPRR